MLQITEWDWSKLSFLNISKKQKILSRLYRLIKDNCILQQVLVYFAVAKKGDLPMDGKTEVNPEGLTAATGKYAQDFADRLATQDLSCKVRILLAHTKKDTVRPWKTCLQNSFSTYAINIRLNYLKSSCGLGSNSLKYVLKMWVVRHFLYRSWRPWKWVLAVLSSWMLFSFVRDCIYKSLKLTRSLLHRVNLLQRFNFDLSK